MITKPPPPPPPVDRSSAFQAPRINSVWNLLTVRLRKAGTIFGDRVKLSLRQIEDENWTKLPRPYLMVVPRQSRAPRSLGGDGFWFINPREATLVAQFDDRMSEASYLAANDIDTAERQLIAAIGGWQPAQCFQPTVYGGMRIQSVRQPDVKVSYTFLLNEYFQLPEEPPAFDPDEIPMAMELEGIGVRVVGSSDCDVVCDPCPPAGPKIVVSGGGPRRQPPPPDPCEDPCPPILNPLGGDSALKSP